MSALSKLEVKQWLTGFIGKAAIFVYKDRDRVGVVKAVKQGPARKVQGFDGFMYLNMPTGDVYFDFVEDGGNGEPKTFKWENVDDFRIVELIDQVNGAVTCGEPKPQLVVPQFINVFRPRPTREGV